MFCAVLDLRQDAAQLIGVAVTMRCFFGERLIDDLLDGQRDVGVEVCDRRWFIAQVSQCQLLLIISFERQSPRQHLEQDNADAIDIRGGAGLFACGLLRRKVMWRASNAFGISDRRSGRESPRNAKVGHFGAAICRDQNILWLDVAMDYAQPVRRANALANLPGDIE